MNIFAKKNFADQSQDGPRTMSNTKSDTVGTSWRCIAACTLVAVCPFQYGIDFGTIGGLQAMPGFLEVSFGRPSSFSVRVLLSAGFRTQGSKSPPWLEHQPSPSATSLFTYGFRSILRLRFHWTAL